MQTKADQKKIRANDGQDPTNLQASEPEHAEIDIEALKQRLLAKNITMAELDQILFNKPVADRVGCYALGGFDDAVDTCLTQGSQQSLHEATAGYIHAANHARVEYCLKRGACINTIASIYASVGNHEKVRQYFALGADPQDISREYRESGDTTAADKYAALPPLQTAHIKNPDEFFKWRYYGAKPISRDKYNKIRINLANKSLTPVTMDIIARMIDQLSKRHSNIISWCKCFFLNADANHEETFWNAFQKFRDDKPSYKDNSQLRNENKLALTNACNLFEETTKRKRKKHIAQFADTTNSTEIYAMEQERAADFRAVENYARAKKRFDNSAQFTLYLKDPYNPNQLRIFVKELEALLQFTGFEAGHLATSDIPISPFISLRHERFNDTPATDETYINGSQSSDETLNKLKAEARNSPLYHHLTLTNGDAQQIIVEATEKYQQRRSGCYGFFFTRQSTETKLALLAFSSPSPTLELSDMLLTYLEENSHRAFGTAVIKAALTRGINLNKPPTAPSRNKDNDYFRLENRVLFRA